MSARAHAAAGSMGFLPPAVGIGTLTKLPKLEAPAQTPWMGVGVFCGMVTFISQFCLAQRGLQTQWELSDSRASPCKYFLKADALEDIHTKSHLSI